MFTSIYAAETQFRLDSAQRDRELAHLTSQRERTATPRLQRAAARLDAARVQLQEVRQRATWARPIGAVPRPAAC